MKNAVIFLVIIGSLACFQSIASGETKVITSIGKFVMGDNDSKTDAKKMALVEAKRLALEEAGTYLTSTTEVNNFQLTKDEISSLAAGVVSVKVTDEKWTMEGESPVVTITINATIQTDDLEERIKALQSNKEDVDNYASIQSELESLKQELEQLKKDQAVSSSDDQVSMTQKETSQDEKQEKINKILALEEFRTGIAYLINNDTGNAIQYFSESIKHAPDNDQAYLKRAEALLKLKRVREAFVNIEQAIQINPDAKRFLLARRVRILRSEHPDKLIKMLSFAIHKNPNCEVYYLLRGDVYFKIKNMKKAVSDYKLACRKGSDEGCRKAKDITKRAMKDTRKKIIFNRHPPRER